MTARAGRLQYPAYGLLGLPLAMAALPVYLHLPAFYAVNLDVGLAQLGWVLFAARLFDTVQDPALGLMVDRLQGRLAPWLAVAAVVFGLAFAALWMPPAGAAPALLWLAVMLVLVYGAHSFLNIAYLAWGASLSAGAPRSDSMLGPAAWREGAGLAGVMLASAIPAAAWDGGTPTDAMLWYSIGFAALLACGLAVLLIMGPAWRRHTSAHPGWRQAIATVRGNRTFLRLLPPYFLNALSVSLPATLALFYIRDQLQSPRQAAQFLSIYFAAAICGLPLWTWLARRLGTARAWRGGMLLAMAGFSGATLLGPGDSLSYAVICLGAGLALGADLALPPVLLAQSIGAQDGSGIYYSIYTLLGKLALACSGLSLAMLSSLGYTPGAGPSTALVALYAGLPCLFKLAAMLTLWRTHDQNPD